MSDSDKNKDRKPGKGKESEGKFTWSRKPGKKSEDKPKSDKPASKKSDKGEKKPVSGKSGVKGSGKGDFSKFIKKKPVKADEAEQDEYRDSKGKRGERSYSRDKPFEKRQGKFDKDRGGKRFDRRDADQGEQREYRGKKGDRPYGNDRSFDKREGKYSGGAAGKRYKKPEPELPTPQEIDKDGMRLNKYLAHAGIASRRKADELIAQGLVEVNGQVVLEMGHKVKETDKVTFKGKRVDREKEFVYVLLNKPKNFITTTNDEKDRDTVMSLVQNASEQRIYPVGRLDRNTTGLLLFTNDGDLAQKMTHPSHGVKKIYHVVLNKALAEADMEAIARGLTLEDGDAVVDNIAYTDPHDLTQIGVDIHIGKNRIVRRIFEHLGYEVEKLDRVYFGGLTKKDLPRGKWRFLEPKEVIMLKHFATGKGKKSKGKEK